MHTRPLPAVRLVPPPGNVVLTRRPDGSSCAAVDATRERPRDAPEFEGGASR